jgi:hypothetical protein
VTRPTRRVLLALVCLVMLGLAALFVLRGEEPARPPSNDVAALARWIAAHPADWMAASAICDAALDSTLPRRFELWRGAHRIAGRLAPWRPNPKAGFVRAGFFHWYELGPADRKAVLDTAAPLLRDPQVFAQMTPAIWQLTRDLGYLRAVAPRTLRSLELLRGLAVTHGRFDEYRALRKEIRVARLESFRAMRAAARPAEMLGILPDRLDTGDVPLVRGVLEELDRRSFEPDQMDGRVDAVARFAIRHGVKPLSGLAPLVAIRGKLQADTRAQLARAVGDESAALRIELTEGVRTTVRETATPWIGLCGDELCGIATRTHEGPLTIRMTVTQSDDIAPYVELYVDDALVDEGPVHDERTFTAGAPGLHRLELRIVNPRTRNGVQRRLRLS